MKTLLLSATAAVALMFAQTPAAQAGNVRFNVSFGNYHQPGFGGYQPGFGGYQQAGWNGGHLHHGVDPAYVHPGAGGHFHWHDTTHVDYLPGRWVQQGCGWVWIPGRSVLHQDGHWDLHH